MPPDTGAFYRSRGPGSHGQNDMWPRARRPAEPLLSQDAGILLGQFMTKNRIIDGPEDGFIARITSWVGA
ncbi:hypothetical protein [Streptomyces sp. ISL-111]|uniref:hypothetical protein n=1 Tax=unclassified Streptomyces TaxID=2593676 RepID=UPI001BE4F007|nr:hypothetical protein [Streptomyces sp. ISL-111]MBT2381927.1 hypothetical protein [Streptomyces sp. ISL-111]